MTAHRKSTTRRTITLLAAAALGVLASCQVAPTRLEGETLYLHDIAPANTGYVPTSRNSAIDTVSYWDGDSASGSPSIRINLAEQKAYFYKGSTLVGISMISSGREGYNTPRGRFKITQKNADHRSNLYGEIYDSSGNVINNDADSRVDKVPRGGRFVGAPMPYFMRIHGGVGMHAGYLPGYAASHGCIRMPEHMAESFFKNVSTGTPVTVE
ncbi:L,D-transpeptidase family protein [Sulfuriroseicoccus oceanibius]|uniref:L,D-transpeptidase family protein n=1 Tax=Sulfuriroseicoccus oceanibius TaxID=2707525 RepID=A0A6B3L8X0_9BACT|nr:L,D-transpeptidase family protein [Sulfuriroseicoccus oceanibius]QQL44383.1 L,D-transpeptidase family protein [Sulfuriroseicoccus oceanibius]